MAFNETLAERIIRERKALVQDRQLWEQVWQTIAEYMFPRRSDINEFNAPGTQKTRKLFDSTAVVAAERLSGAMAGVVTPPTMQWFDMELPELEFLVPKAVLDWIGITGRRVFRDLQNSNFDTEIQELYHDMVTFGTGALFITTNDQDQLSFRALHPGEYAIDTDSDGRVTKLIRDVQMSIREAARRFGIANLSEEMQRKIRENEDVDKEKFLFAQWIIKRNGEEFGFPVDNFPVASIWVDVKQQHITRRSGFDEWPCPVARWNVSSNAGEMYGRSPAWTALPDVLSLNKAEEFGLRAWAMSIMPPLLAMHDGVLGKPDLRPARLNFVNQEGALQWFPPGTRLDIETVNREDKRRSIWNIFFMDQVQFVPERGKTPPSAEEVRARLNIMLQILGPQLARVEHELLVPVLDRVFGLRARQGKLPPAPQIVQDFAAQAGGQLDISFIGPIARAKREVESQAIDEFLNFVGAGSQVFPRMRHVVNEDSMVREKARIKMIPRKILRSRAEVEQMIAAEAEQQQQLLQAQQLESVTKSISNAAPASQAEDAANEREVRSL